MFRRWPGGYGLVSAALTYAFDELQVSISFWREGDDWDGIHDIPGITSVRTSELEHGVGPKRWAYNRRLFAQAQERNGTVRGEHNGFFDLFVPIQGASGTKGILVTGPFAISQPTSASIRHQWQEITGAQARLNDFSFARYVTSVLAILTLEGPLYKAFERFVQCFAELASDRGDLDKLASEAETLRRKLLKTRTAEKMWDVVQSLLNTQSARTWPTHSGSTLADLGLKSAPLHVVAGLFLTKHEEQDPLDDLLRRAAFQRACTELASSLGRTLAGRIGEHGVSFLVDDPGSSQRVRNKLVELVTKATSIGRKFGLELYAGTAYAKDSASLPDGYRVALRAAEKALTEKIRVVHGQPQARGSAEPLGELRRELTRSIEQQPELLAPRFDRYAEAVLAQTGYGREATQVGLELGLERLAETLLEAGSFDRRAFNDLHEAMDRAAQNTRTVAELIAAYRGLVSDVESAVRQPLTARQERTTRRAASFIREHLDETLSLDKVARIAGFAPSHFARLFKRDEGAPFSEYVQKVRIERAKVLLTTTQLSLAQVQKHCGFRARPHFYRMFKQAVGTTPAEYRQRVK